MRSEAEKNQRKDARETIIDLLRGQPNRARFMSEVQAALGRAAIERDQADQALRELEAEGAVMIRDHYCADPHLAGADLRIVALAESRNDDDPQLSAIRAIDESWNKWLSEYLSNHRCG